MAFDGIGSLGDIGFIAVLGPDRAKVRAFKDLERSTQARYATNDIHLKKPRKHFLGPGLDSITFTVIFDVSLGMNPRVEMEKLLKYCNEGKALKFVLGGKAMGVNKWTIDSMTQSFDIVDNKGNTLRSTLSVTLGEYA